MHRRNILHFFKILLTISLYLPSVHYIEQCFNVYIIMHIYTCIILCIIVQNFVQKMKHYTRKANQLIGKTIRTEVLYCVLNTSGMTILSAFHLTIYELLF